MAVYVVAYDLNKERKGWENDRAKLLAHIKENWSWARLSESSYAIEAYESAAVVLAALRQYLDDNDNLYIITLTRPWDGWGSKDVIDWLTSKLGYP